MAPAKFTRHVIRRRLLFISSVRPSVGKLELLRAGKRAQFQITFKLLC